MAKRIVVTGASGNVGTALLRRLTAAPEGFDELRRHLSTGTLTIRENF